MPDRPPSQPRGHVRTLLAALALLILLLAVRGRDLRSAALWNAANIQVAHALGATSVERAAAASAAAAFAYARAERGATADLRSLLAAYSAENAAGLDELRAGGYWSEYSRAYPQQAIWMLASALGRTDTALAAREANSITAAPNELCLRPGETFDLAALPAESIPGRVKPVSIEGRSALLVYTSAPLHLPVCTAEDGLYRVQVEAVHLEPAPIDIAVSWDGWLAGILRFDRADGSLGADGLQVAAAAGAHTLGLYLANDRFVPDEQIDRNALLVSVAVEPAAEVEPGQNGSSK